MSKCYTIEPGEYIDEENYFRCNIRESNDFGDWCPYQDNDNMSECKQFKEGK